MNSIKKKAQAGMIILVMLVATACGSKQSKTEQHEDHSGKEYTSAYICPMHCEGSGSDAEGKCPVCEMDYVKNKKEE